jgi:hypothetical protein
LDVGRLLKAAIIVRSSGQIVADCSNTKKLSPLSASVWTSAVKYVLGIHVKVSRSRAHSILA